MQQFLSGTFDGLVAMASLQKLHLFVLLFSNEHHWCLLHPIRISVSGVSREELVPLQILQNSVDVGLLTNSRAHRQEHPILVFVVIAVHYTLRYVFSALCHILNVNTDNWVPIDRIL